MAESHCWLIARLKDRSAPLLIDLVDGCIVASGFGFDGPYDFNVTFHHMEGDISMGCDVPTRAEHLGLNTPDFAELSYAEKKRKALDRYDEEDVWLVFDEDGAVKPESDTEDRLIAWLSTKLKDEEASTCPLELSQFYPGLEIYSAVPKGDRARLGLRQVFWGSSPAHAGFAAVEVKATPNELNAVLVATGLPFRVREVEGSTGSTESKSSEPRGSAERGGMK